MSMKGVYLLHFEQAFGHARHYTGYADNIAVRLALHQAGRGARLMEVVSEAGITWVVARVWPGADRNKERRLKRSGSASRYCPLCLGRPIRGQVTLTDGLDRCGIMVLQA